MVSISVSSVFPEVITSDPLRMQLMNSQHGTLPERSARALLLVLCISAPLNDEEVVAIRTEICLLIRDKRSSSNYVEVTRNLLNDTLIRFIL